MRVGTVIRSFAVAASLTIASTSPAFAIAGIGVHYGMDLSLQLDDKIGEQASLGDLKLNVTTFGNSTTLPSNLPMTVLTGDDLPITINRTDWKPHPFNMGGKLFIDIIPFLDAIELSMNYGMWEYNGSIKYPTGITFNGNNPAGGQGIEDFATVTYDSTKVTMKGLGLDNPFITNTPYAKLQFDLTIRKFVMKLPPVVNIIKIYAGAGASTFFATPVLSAGFIQKTLGNTLETVSDINQLQSAVFGQNSAAMKKLGEQFMKDLMTPYYGAHLDVGVQVKAPIIPIGLYVDGKFLMPFSDLDKDVKLSGRGLLINAGLLFGI